MKFIESPIYRCLNKFNYPVSRDPLFSWPGGNNFFYKTRPKVVFNRDIFSEVGAGGRLVVGDYERFIILFFLN